MKKNDAFSYNVRPAEKITVKVTAKNFLDSLISVRAELDGEVLDEEPNTQDAPVFEFTVTKAVDDIHTLMMEFTFVTGTPQNAEYDVSISGQNDKGCPCGFVILKTTQDLSPDIEFVVVA
ncbi:MAG: hypothetical protein QOI77_3544 [Blastocatellia bacterium]|jgi:hypothetical protein|nr:hypothetical protein [Blastocatellia bacterium]